MENLLVYVMENLMRFGEIRKSEFQLGGEDCWHVFIDDAATWTFTRHELMELRGIIHERLAYMTDDDVALWNRLLSQLDVQ